MATIGAKTVMKLNKQKQIIKKIDLRTRSQQAVLIKDSGLFSEMNGYNVMLTINKGIDAEVSLSDALNIINCVKRHVRRVSSAVLNEVANDKTLTKHFKSIKMNDLPFILSANKLDKKRAIGFSEINLKSVSSGSFNFEIAILILIALISSGPYVYTILKSWSDIIDLFCPKEPEKLERDLHSAVKDTNIVNVHISIINNVHISNNQQGDNNQFNLIVNNRN